MSETPEALHPNVQITLTCGNAKCGQEITSQVVTAHDAAHVEHMMATQQVQCPSCQKVGRNHVAKEGTSAALTSAREGVTPKSHAPVADDSPRRYKGDSQRKSSTPAQRGSRRRGTRAAGKTAIPPMSARQREKLERRGQAEGVLAAPKSTEQVERSRTNQPQVPTPQPTKGGAPLRGPRQVADVAQPRTRSNAAREAAAPPTPAPEAPPAPDEPVEPLAPMPEPGPPSDVDIPPASTDTPAS